MLIPVPKTKKHEGMYTSRILLENILSPNCSTALTPVSKEDPDLLKGIAGNLLLVKKAVNPDGFYFFFVPMQSKSIMG